MFKRFSLSKEVRFEIVVQIASKFSVQVPMSTIGNQVKMVVEVFLDVFKQTKSI